MYYASRLTSSQKGVEFEGSKYEGIKKIYSIWVITNLSKREKSSINNYRILEENVLGDYNVSSSNYDLIDIITIRLGSDYNNTKIMKLLNLLLRDDKVNKRMINIFKFFSSRFYAIAMSMPKVIEEECM